MLGVQMAAIHLATMHTAAKPGGAKNPQIVDQVRKGDEPG